METTIIILVALAVVAVVAVAVITFMGRQRRTGYLKDRYGDEYERTVSDGSRTEAERELMAREERVKRLHIKELDDKQRDLFAEEWRPVQVRFVDDPGATIKDADELVRRVMDARGYPMTDFEQLAADISVDHSEVVSNYRAAHDIALKHERDEASTEDLRQAVIHYRELFNELLGKPAMTR